MTAPLRIGLVDLETSHPAAFVPVLRALGHEVTAVLDEHAMRGPDYAGEFARRHGVPAVARDIPELSRLCDVAFLLGTDWDRHLDQIRVLRGLGVPVLVDKPVAGRAGDLRAVAAMTDGPRVTGGSSLRTADEVSAWSSLGLTARTIRATCSGPPFYYGVHAVSLALGLVGEGVVAARATSSGEPFAGEIRHRSGTSVRIEVPRAPGATYRAEIRTTTDERHVVQPAGDRLYRPFLTACLDYLTGRRDVPWSPLGLVEPELALLAMAWSARDNGRWVDLDQVPDDWQPWQGASFAAEYRASLARA